MQPSFTSSTTATTPHLYIPENKTLKSFFKRQSVLFMMNLVFEKMWFIHSSLGSHDFESCAASFAKSLVCLLYYSWINKCATEFFDQRLKICLLFVKLCKDPVVSCAHLPREQVWWVKLPLNILARFVLPCQDIHSAVPASSIMSHQSRLLAANSHRFGSFVRSKKLFFSKLNNLWVAWWFSCTVYVVFASNPRTPLRWLGQNQSSLKKNTDTWNILENSAVESCSNDMTTLEN